MQDFEKSFEEFCKSPGIESGKARSYAKAIRYLCDFMKIDEMDAESIRRIKEVESSVKDVDSAFYVELLQFLSGRRQKSYLEGGFIRAALNYFEFYIEQSV